MAPALLFLTPLKSLCPPACKAQSPPKLANMNNGPDIRIDQGMFPGSHPEQLGLKQRPGRPAGFRQEAAPRSQVHVLCCLMHATPLGVSGFPKVEQQQCRSGQVVLQGGSNPSAAKRETDKVRQEATKTHYTLMGSKEPRLILIIRQG